MDPQKLQQSIDACRPGSDDLDHPEMALLAERLADDPHARQLYERIQHLDTAIVGAFLDVPVPEGLAERLLSAVSSQAGRLDSSADDLSVQPLSAEESLNQQDSLVTARRGATTPRRFFSWKFQLSAAAAVIFVAAGLYYAYGWTAPLSQDVVMEQAQKWTVKVTHSDYVWNPVGTPLPTDRPLDSLSLRRNASQWQKITTTYDNRAVVYNLAQPSEVRSALLFVIHVGNRRDNLPIIADATPQSQSGKFCVGAWRKGDLLYVLAVEGDTQRYRSFVQVTSLACLIDKL